MNIEITFTDQEIEDIIKSGNKITLSMPLIKGNVANIQSITDHYRYPDLSKFKEHGMSTPNWWEDFLKIYAKLVNNPPAMPKTRIRSGISKIQLSKIYPSATGYGYIMLRPHVYEFMNKTLNISLSHKEKDAIEDVFGYERWDGNKTRAGLWIDGARSTSIRLKGLPANLDKESMKELINESFYGNI